MTRARRVPNQRSTWQVSPSALVQQRCVLAGKATRYASQRSLRVARPRSSGGKEARRSPALCWLRSPKVQPHDLAGSSAQGHPQPERLRLALHEAPKLVEFEHVALLSG